MEAQDRVGPVDNLVQQGAEELEGRRRHDQVVGGDRAELLTAMIRLHDVVQVQAKVVRDLGLDQQAGEDLSLGARED